MDSALSAAFVLPRLAFHRTAPARPLHCLRHSSTFLLRFPARCTVRTLPISALQASTLSNDSDGQVDDTPPQKSYSVGLTIVSACDPVLRTSLIEHIVAQSNAGRVVVVTTGGILSTDDQHGRVPTPAIRPVASENPNSLLQIDPQLDSDPAQSRPSSDTMLSSPVPNLEGWIACSSPEEMAQVIAKLAAGRECDYIIAEGAVESSIEPQELAQLIHARGGASLRVDTLVSVLDTSTILHDLSTHTADSQIDNEQSDSPLDDDPTSSTPPDSMADTPDSRPMQVVSLVENSNVIVINETPQLAQAENRSQVQSLLALLNGKANILSSTEFSVPVDQLVNTRLYDYENFRMGATWKRVLKASRAQADGTAKPLIPKSLKEATFVYRARRPFHPARLYAQIRAVATFDGVIRSMGRIWLATRMLAPLEWNQAGVAATLRVGKLFWAAVPESEWPSEEAERENIMKGWDNQYGDRETEIVFIGKGIDKERLQGMLDGCLLQDEEMVFTNMWENFEDPFVEWVPLIEEEDDTVSEVDEEAPIEVTAPAETATDSSVETVRADEGDEIPEGEVDSVELPEEVFSEISAMDILDRGLGEDSLSVRMSQPVDDGAFDSDDVVIASWDTAEADGILKQMPSVGLPVTLVTGFLGSGKTTLLNYILTANHKRKIAVLVNEFGEIDIDNQLVEKGDWSSADEVMELANGCICCSINDSFLEAVNKVINSGKEVDYLIVETTGVADPVPVINSLMVSDIAQKVRVDGILTLVDAENFDAKTHMGSEAALSQIMAADTILLSKTDIASESKVEETIAYIKSIRPGARILRSQRGRVPLDMILDVGLRVADSPTYLEPVKKEDDKHTHDHEHSHDLCHDHNHSHDHDHSHNHNHSHDHDHSHGHDHSHEHGHDCGPDCTDETHSHNHLEADGFVTTSFKSDRALDPELFMDKFLQRLPEGVFRAKGLLRFYGYGQRYIFQLSGRRYQFEEDEWPEGVAPSNQLVIIGKDLDLEALRNSLEACHADDEV